MAEPKPGTIMQPRPIVYGGRVLRPAQPGVALPYQPLYAPGVTPGMVYGTSAGQMITGGIGFDSGARLPITDFEAQRRQRMAAETQSVQSRIADVERKAALLDANRAEIDSVKSDLAARKAELDRLSPTVTPGPYYNRLVREYNNRVGNLSGLVGEYNRAAVALETESIVVKFAAEDVERSYGVDVGSGFIKQKFAGMEGVKVAPLRDFGPQKPLIEVTPAGAERFVRESLVESTRAPELKEKALEYKKTGSPLALTRLVIGTQQAAAFAPVETGVTAITAPSGYAFGATAKTLWPEFTPITFDLPFVGKREITKEGVTRGAVFAGEMFGFLGVGRFGKLKIAEPDIKAFAKSTAAGTKEVFAEAVPEAVPATKAVSAAKIKAVLGIKPKPTPKLFHPELTTATYWKEKLNLLKTGVAPASELQYARAFTPPKPSFKMTERLEKAFIGMEEAPAPFKLTEQAKAFLKEAPKPTLKAPRGDKFFEIVEGGQKELTPGAKAFLKGAPKPTLKAPRGDKFFEIVEKKGVELTLRAREFLYGTPVKPTVKTTMRQLYPRELTASEKMTYPELGKFVEPRGGVQQLKQIVKKKPAPPPGGYYEGWPPAYFESFEMAKPVEKVISFAAPESYGELAKGLARGTPPVEKLFEKEMRLIFPPPPSKATTEAFKTGVPEIDKFVESGAGLQKTGGYASLQDFIGELKAGETTQFGEFKEAGKAIGGEFKEFAAIPPKQFGEFLGPSPHLAAALEGISPGYKEYLKSEQGFEIETKQKIEPVSIPTSRIKESAIVLPGASAKMVSKAFLGVEPISRVSEATMAKTSAKQKALVEQALKTGLESRTGVALRRAMAARQTYKIVTGTMIRIGEMEKPKDKDKWKPIYIPLPEVKKLLGKPSKALGYKVLVRAPGKRVAGKWKPGKFKPLGEFVLPREEALALGQKAVAGAAKRTFKLEPAYGKLARLATAGRFRPEMFVRRGRTYIERAKYAIDTLGEKQQITAKGIAASQAKASSLFGFKPIKKKRKTKRRKS